MLKYHITSLIRIPYSPNSFRTRFSTLSFSGSYGWSLLGISSTAGKASVKESTLLRMRSAICFVCYESYMSVRLYFTEDVQARQDGQGQGGTHMLVNQHDGDVLPLAREVVEGLFDGRGLGLGVDDEEVALRVGRVGDVLYFNIS